MNDDNTKREQSEFNMAVSYLNRINQLFYISNEASIGLDMHTWFHCLLSIFRELSTEMKDSEIVEFEKDINNINNLITTQIKKSQRQHTSSGVDNELYNMLHHFELKLRKIMKESGLQLRIMDDAAKALR